MPDATLFIGKYKRYSNEIQLIILDMIMPEMDGYDVLNKLKTIDPNIKTIICSGFPLDQQKDKLAELGVSGYINKPYTLQELSQVISDTL